MGHINDILKNSAVFSALEEDDITTVSSFFEKWEIHSGDILATEKETAQYFFLISSGMFLLAMDGGRAVVLNTAGDFIGLELLSAKGVYSATVTALEPGRVYAIPTRDFLAFIRQDSTGAAVIMERWQEYLDKTAPFAKNIEDLTLPYQF